MSPTKQSVVLTHEPGDREKPTDNDALTSLLARHNEVRQKGITLTGLLLLLCDRQREALRLDEDVSNFSYNDLLDMRVKIITILAEHTIKINAMIK